MRVTLTFDNGPTPGETSRVLECLDHAGIKAVFFVVGEQLKDAAGMEQVRLARDLGHRIGTHTLTHSVALGDRLDREYAHKELYTMALCGGAAAAAGLTAPLQTAMGGSWSNALAIWAVPALAAALLWAPQAPRLERQASFAGVVISGLYRCPLAWSVTLFMILQSMLSFSVFGWLAPILHARGLSLVTAGVIVSVSVLCQTVACLVAPGIAA
jgi:CP family cyanate transporter-like MFS transporter